MRTIDHPLEVATCIACGARSRYGDCPDGCQDVPLDLVEVEALKPLEAELERTRARVVALRAIAQALSTDDGSGWPELRHRAREALRRDRAPATVAEVEIVEAWGCPVCGRVDAPQPCLGVCVRRPVAMVDAQRLHDLLEARSTARAAEARLSAVARLLATVTPRADQEERTRAALGERARAALDAPP